MRSFFLPIVAVAGVAALASTGSETPPSCTIVPEQALLLLHVEKDTMLPHADVEGQFMSASGVRRGPDDSLLAVQGTPMPGARVRLLQMDSSTQATLRRARITDGQPLAFIRAAPYRADCRTVRWTDSLPWLERHDTGYARATLVPRSQWIAGTPVFIIRNTWYYPYPRQRGLAHDVPNDRPLASAQAMYSLNAMLEAGGVPMHDFVMGSDTAGRRRALDWATSHLSDAELEPVREFVRQAILAPDWDEAQRTRSRLRGSYQVTMESEGSRRTWYFRTVDHPSYGWPEGDTIRTTANLLASPHVFGYRLVGYAAPARAELVEIAPVGPDMPLVWLAAADRPTVAGNEARLVLRGQLEFRLAVAPAGLWDILEMFVPAPSGRDSLMMTLMPEAYTRANKQPRFPMTIRLDGAGSVRADTTLTRNGKTLRVSLVRVDTISVDRPF